VEAGSEKSGLGTLTEEEEEDKRIAELGKPRLGEYKSVEIIIEESYEFKVGENRDFASLALLREEANLSPCQFF